MSLYPRETAGKRVHVVQKGTRGRGGKARVPVECGDTRSSGTRKRGGTGARTKAYRKNPPLFHFTRTTAKVQRGIALPRRPIPSSPPFHLSALVSMSFPAARHILHPSHPISRSLPVSDRVPLFRVLYYFFYQSARFQDALRPAESCAINHEM